MTIHLGMSGTIHLVKNATSDNTNLSFYHSKNLPNKHNHVILNFGSFNIIYNDPRRFGYFKLHDSKKSLDKFIKQSGLEPLDRNFNYKYLSIKIQNREKILKIFF